MRGWWGDVTARAAGLATHLLEGPALDTLASGDLAGLAETLRGRAFPLDPADATAPARLEAAVRREAGRRLTLLRRWLGRRAAAAAVVTDEEELRSLRALLRGAGAGAAPAARLEGLVPTPDLPEEALQRLARLDSPAEVARALAERDHPYGPALLEALRTRPVVGRRPGDLFELETALDARFAERVTRAARRGSRHLRAYAALSVDLRNAWTALLADGLTEEVDAAALFLEGGRALTPARFREIASLPAGERGARLAATLGPGPVGAAFAAGRDPAAIETAVLAARIAAERRVARTDPGGPAPFLAFALRLRAEAVNLTLLAWGIALGAPPALIREGLVPAGGPG